MGEPFERRQARPVADLCQSNGSVRPHERDRVVHQLRQLRNTARKADVTESHGRVPANGRVRILDQPGKRPQPTLLPEPAQGQGGEGSHGIMLTDLVGVGRELLQRRKRSLVTDERKSQGDAKADVGMLILTEPFRHMNPVFMGDFAQGESEIPADEGLLVSDSPLKERNRRTSLSQRK